VRSALRDFEAILERWFYKPDRQAMRIVLGTLQAHYLNAGDPTSLFIVAPPGTGKTAIMSAPCCPRSIPVSDFMKNTFLSGFYDSRQPGVGISTSPTISRMATQQGVLLGRAAYMSPEHAKASGPAS